MPTIQQCAYVHSTDINPELSLDSKKWDDIANICVARATKALNGATGNYTEIQRHQIEDVLNSMLATHRTIRHIIENTAQPQAVDSLALARLQLEGLYAICLMLEGPEFVTQYMQDHWRKMFVLHLLFHEETKLLPRMEEFRNSIAPIQQIIILKSMIGITDAQMCTVELEELGKPLPASIPQKQSIPQFPTPGKVIDHIKSSPKKKAMLIRLHMRYIELCSFAHGLAKANYMKIMFDARRPEPKFFTDAQIQERFQREVIGPAYTMSFFSIAQCVAELLTLYPGNLEIVEAVAKGWEQLSVADLLSKAVWEMRTRELLGAIG